MTSIFLTLQNRDEIFVKEHEGVYYVSSSYEGKCKRKPCGNFCYYKLQNIICYDVISSRWSSHFGVKIHVFKLSSTIKVNPVAKIMQSAYLCVIFHVKHKKNLFLAVLTWFLSFGKIQDGDHCWWRHRPPTSPPPIKYTSSCQEDQRLSTKGKVVSKYCNISKTPGRAYIHVHPPPLPMYHGGGMNLRLRPKIKYVPDIHFYHS